jgi:DNA topoisomerase I
MPADNGSVPDAPAVAEAAGLVYVSDAVPGITRRRCGRGFVYHQPDGRKVDAATRQRIEGLAIPPAWAEVWIAPKERGHIQAIGRDQRRRKQYLYHPRWSETRDATKFHRMIAFGEALPRLRRTVRRHLSDRSLSREKVLALAVRLMESTAIRVGNDEYAKENGAYGLTTLTSRHVSVRGKQLHFRFRGKGGKVHEVGVADARLARLVKQCLELPGYELFHYRADNGEVRVVDSGEFNQYLRETMGGPFTAKDFRTWIGTVLAVSFLLKAGEPATFPARKKISVDALKYVAKHLGNTQSTCRKYYIHPIVLESYLEGGFGEILKRRKVRKGWRGLYQAEQGAMKLLVEASESN